MKICKRLDECAALYIPARQTKVHHDFWHMCVHICIWIYVPPPIYLLEHGLQEAMNQTKITFSWLHIGKCVCVCMYILIVGLLRGMCSRLQGTPIFQIVSLKSSVTLLRSQVPSPRAAQGTITQ